MSSKTNKENGCKRGLDPLTHLALIACFIPSTKWKQGEKCMINNGLPQFMKEFKKSIFEKI